MAWKIIVAVIVLVRFLVRLISGAETMAFVGPSDLAVPHAIDRNLVLYFLYTKVKDYKNITLKIFLRLVSIELH